MPGALESEQTRVKRTSSIGFLSNLSTNDKILEGKTSVI
jgi:hypothetical protein